VCEQADLIIGTQAARSEWPVAIAPMKHCSRMPAGHGSVVRVTAIAHRSLRLGADVINYWTVATEAEVVHYVQRYMCLQFDAKISNVYINLLM